jgi:hypothetical protein
VVAKFRFLDGNKMTSGRLRFHSVYLGNNLRDALGLRESKILERNVVCSLESETLWFVRYNPN